MNRIKLLCIFITISGTGLFVSTLFFLSPSSLIFHWCIALASALIILGLGYLVNVLLLLSESEVGKAVPRDPCCNTVKQRAGFLVCKIMNVLLCIYLLILNYSQVEPFILILSISLVVIQYLLDLFLQIFLSGRQEGQNFDD